MVFVLIQWMQGGPCLNGVSALTRDLSKFALLSIIAIYEIGTRLSPEPKSVKLLASISVSDEL